MRSILVSLMVVAPAARARTIWSSSPASDWSDLIRTAFPVGNGRLGVLPYGVPGQEKLNLNEASLWSGGPFEESNYTGGNPIESKAAALPGIQEGIFETGSGNVSALQNDFSAYGSYAVLGNLSVTLEGVNDVASYNRSLDLSTGVHTTSYTSGNGTVTTRVLCSYPDHVCVYDVSTTGTLPSIRVTFEDVMRGPDLSTPACSATDRMASIRSKAEPNNGMNFFAAAEVIGNASMVTCDALGYLAIAPSNLENSLTLVIAAGTDYDQGAGNAAAGYTFRGEDPEAGVLSTLATAASKSIDDLLQTHIADFTPLMSSFELDLPDIAGSSGLEVSDQLDRYDINNGDPYFEAQQFDFGRYLFVSSSRNGSLPPNLQGKWAYGLTSAWSADYHVDINLQMNHWGVSETGLGGLQQLLWDYMADTWVGRGSETAEKTYGGDGWVVHGWINTFGSTGLPIGDDDWTLLTSSNAWLMLHVADHFEYSQDTAWLGSVGYPTLIKPVAQFWISQLLNDSYFHDGTLVVNPCISPEQPPTTFGCSHHQQLLHQLFTNTLRLAPLASETDSSFLASVRSTLAGLDKGLHIGSWSQIQEWKMDIDVQNNTHRHLSHLIGWYPGASIASYADGYFTNATIQDSVRTTLISRGPGIADSNAGWEKVWRAACWARLNDSDTAYSELKLALGSNYAPNLLSMYSGRNEPFQIDANFGFVGAVISMLVVDLPTADEVYNGQGVSRTVVLGPAIPKAWGGGSVKGLNIRGGAVVNFAWDDEGTVNNVQVARNGVESITLVNVKGEEVPSSYS